MTIRDLVYVFLLICLSGLFILIIYLFAFGLYDLLT